MKRFVVTGLIAASVALNVFFVFGYSRARIEAARVDSLDGGSRVIADRIGLDEEQRLAFVEFRRSVQQRQATAARSQWGDVEDFWSTIISGVPDEAAFDEIMTHVNDLRAEAMNIEVDELRQFLEQLSPEQKAAYVALVRERNQQRANRAR